MTPLIGLAAPPTTRSLHTPRQASPDEALALGRELESVFLARMLEPMMSSVPTDGPFGGGHGEAMFRSLLVDAYGAGLARTGGIGLAPAIQQEILRIQESHNG